jgi:hypothetical protein
MPPTCSRHNPDADRESPSTALGDLAGDRGRERPAGTVRLDCDPARYLRRQFFLDAPIPVFPISWQDTGSGVFTVAVAALLLGFGPLRTDTA